MSDMIAEEKLPEVKEADKNQSPVTENKQGYLSANSLEGRWRIASAVFRGGMAPKSYQSASQVFAAMEYSIQLGVSPMVGLQKIAVINGSPSIWGELPLALAYKNKLVENHELFLIDKEYNKICFANKNLHTKPWAAVCRLLRKDSDLWHETFFTIDMAKNAKLLDKKSPWSQGYDWRMLQWRCVQQALKDMCADAFFGISMAEYDFNYSPTEAEIKEVSYQGKVKLDPAKELNKLGESNEGAGITEAVEPDNSKQTDNTTVSEPPTEKKKLS